MDSDAPKSCLSCRCCGIDWELSVGQLLALTAVVLLIGTIIAFAGPIIALLLLFSNWLSNFDVALVLVIYTAAIVFLTPFCFPFTVFAIIGGYVFRTTAGSLVAGVVFAVTSVQLGYGAGSVVGFYLGRTLLRECAARIVAQTKVLAALDSVLGGPSGLRLNALLRLSPIVPYQALMYGLAMTKTSPQDFALGFLVGGFPYAIVMCWLGALLSGLESASDVTDAADPQGQSAVLVLYICGAVATVALAVCLQRAATAEIDAQMSATGPRGCEDAAVAEVGVRVVPVPAKAPADGNR